MAIRDPLRDTFGPVELSYREPSRLTFWIGVGVATAASVLAVVHVIVQRPAATDTGLTLLLFAFVAVIAGAILAVAGATAPGHIRRKGTIEASGGRLRVNGVARRAVTEVDVSADEVTIFSGRHQADLVVRARSSADAAHLAAALVAPRMTLRVAAASTDVGFLVWLVGIATVVGGIAAASMSGAATWILLSSVGIVLLRARATATVGADGIAVTFLGRTTFVPFSAVTRVETDIIRLENRRPIRLVGQRAGASDRIEKARLAARSPSALAIEPLLARGEQSRAAWRAELERVARATYRDAAAPREQLWRIAESAGDASARLGAAILLQKDASPADRARLEHIAASVASPELRDLLDEELRGTMRG